MSRIIYDVEQLSDGLLLGFTQFFSGILTILGTLIFMLVTNIRIALVVVLITPVSLLVAAFISKNTFGFFKLRNEIGGRQTALVNERIDGMKLVQDFGYEKADMEQFESLGPVRKQSCICGSGTHRCALGHIRRYIHRAAQLLPLICQPVHKAL